MIMIQLRRNSLAEYIEVSQKENELVNAFSSNNVLIRTPYLNKIQNSILIFLIKCELKPLFSPTLSILK